MMQSTVVSVGDSLAPFAETNIQNRGILALSLPYVRELREYKLKRCFKKECYKQCRYVKFRGTMTKWPNL